MTNPQRFLVVAHSARLLAQSASRAGYPVCALDLFNDADTAHFAPVSEVVRARAGRMPGFDRQDLLQRAARLCPPSTCLGLVYGAGFEDDVDTLALLADGRQLLGNPPELVARLKDPTHFFGLLDRLSIPHPQTVLTRPGSARGWLYKRRGASGGAHVVDAAGVPDDADEGEGYFQRRLTGSSLSLLFLADGRRADVIGVSRQLTRRTGAGRYTYAGAVGPIDLPPGISRRLSDALQALVAHTGLVGCNSIDFLLDHDRLAVLEINPRPSATIDLYDDDWPKGLFDAHVCACRGQLPARPVRDRARPVRAHAIVYAATTLRVAPDATFPAWCSDVPRAGAEFGCDAPVCTVHAAGADLPAAMRQLGRRRRQTDLRLTTRQDTEEKDDAGTHSAPKRQSQCGPVGRVAAGPPR